MEKTKKVWNEKNDVAELIRRLRVDKTNVVDIDDSQSIICTCKRCQNRTELSTNNAQRSKFFRCRKCGYVVGPIIKSVPKQYWYIVHDEANTIEPQKWFGDENDAKEYVRLCGLSKDQIRKIYAWGS